MGKIVILVLGVLCVLSPRLSRALESSQSCEGCHREIYWQYNDSVHKNAFNDPVFWASYFKIVVPRVQKDGSYRASARKCLACHSPVLHMNYTGAVVSPEQAFAVETGVTCDFCHSFIGYGKDGNYLVSTDGKKHGPLASSRHHASESQYIPSSDFCASCHNAVNHQGAEVRTTYDEWNLSAYKDKKITCQECHMSKHGYIKNGKGAFEVGHVAQITTDSGVVTFGRGREKLYDHGFPGAHTSRQIEGAIKLEATPGKARLPDGAMIVDVAVDNSRTGHKMPSGSSDLRFMWLEVTAASPQWEFPVRHFDERPGGKVDYGIAGSAPEDHLSLGTMVPPGSRIYRTIFVDPRGKKVELFADASRNIFDNRLAPEEVRREKYIVTLPPQYTGSVTITATLYYAGAPPSFTRRLGVRDFKPLKVASFRKDIPVLGQGRAVEEKR
jgi:nitrate/TMAO reductase-like tetraheme cytochrome c subunit